MTTRTKIIIAFVAGIALVALGIAVWALSTRPFADEDHLGTDHSHEISDPLIGEPGQAATSAMTALMTWDPANQSSPQESAAAIGERLTGVLGDYAASGEPDSALPQMWDTWANDGDSVHAVAVLGEDGVVTNPTGDGAEVDVDVTQTVWHSSGATTPFSEFSATVVVDLVEGEWRASNYEITDVDY